MSEVNVWYPRVLVLGSGGYKGFSIMGFLVPLDDEKILSKIDTYCGVSVGSLISLLLAIGYSPREIIIHIIDLDLFKNCDISIVNIIEYSGLMSNNVLREKISRLVVQKLGTIPSLYDLYLMTGKSYISTTFNVTDSKCEMMGPFTHPTVSCVDATLYSMNIPFIFYQLIHDNKTYVDGALANSYPVDYFDNGETNILGVYINTITNSNESSFTDYFGKILQSMLDQKRLSVLSTTSECCRHIKLDVNGSNGLSLMGSTEDKLSLISLGLTAGNRYLKCIYDDTEDKLSYTARKYQYPTYYY